MKKRVLKIFGLILILVLIAIQFVPVSHENPPVDKSLDFLETELISAEGRDIMKNACYDCHSYETKYPWYSYVAPFSFAIENHILEGREELNFSEFKNYSAKKRDHKLEEMVDALKEGWMPLEGYVKFHSEAELTKEQRNSLASEINALR